MELLHLARLVPVYPIQDFRDCFCIYPDLKKYFFLSNAYHGDLHLRRGLL